MFAVYTGSCCKTLSSCPGYNTHAAIDSFWLRPVYFGVTLQFHVAELFSGTNWISSVPSCLLMMNSSGLSGHETTTRMRSDTFPCPDPVAPASADSGCAFGPWITTVTVDDIFQYIVLGTLYCSAPCCSCANQSATRAASVIGAG